MARLRLALGPIILVIHRVSRRRDAKGPVGPGPVISCVPSRKPGMPSAAAPAAPDFFPRNPLMSKNNTVIRSLHDLGLAAWFGGSLAGAVGFNGAAADVPKEKMRLRVANAAWARWAPVNLAAIAAHLLGGAGLLYANKGRVAAQKGVGASTAAKTALTGAA